jgi:transcription termination factor Rho
MSGDRASLEKKDKGELQTIVEAMGGKAAARAKKSDLIDSILDLSGASGGGSSAPAPSPNSPEHTRSPAASESATSPVPKSSRPRAAKPSAKSDGNADSNRGDYGAKKSQSGGGGSGRSRANPQADPGKSDNKSEGGSSGNKSDDGDGDQGGEPGNERDRGEKREDDDGNRRRRRGRGRGRDREEDGAKAEPEPVAGYLDLREEGYGFLRVEGYLPTKDDIYVSVKQVRTGALRRGDYLTGTARPASRNEKNAALHSLDTVNGKKPEEIAERPLFDQLTPVMPSEALVLERKGEPNITGRVIDLLAPIGKGQRGLVVSPPQAGKTSTLVEIAKSIEANHPDIELIVLLVDERPEEVTEIRRQLESADVMASTFDRPPDEHTAVAELTLARAQRIVEEGQDVCVLIDGITRLARAYNQSAPHTGRSLGGGLDAAAIHPTKRLFGAARALQEGASLTVIATVAVETGAELDVHSRPWCGTSSGPMRYSISSMPSSRKTTRKSFADFLPGQRVDDFSRSVRIWCPP